MENQISYNLSSIPLFSDILNNVYNANETNYTCKDYTTKNNETYTFVKYIKEALNYETIKPFGLLRSVILHNSKVVCFSPPKSLHSDLFMLHNSVKTKYIIAEEFVEGTMVNVFYNEELKSWKIATRNTVDADVSFYQPSEMTFKQMFVDACLNINLDLNNLNTKYCYSFVLQHPSNRIVVSFKTPQIYLIAVYEITQSNENIIIIEKQLTDIPEGIKLPQQYEFSTYTDLINKYASKSTPFETMGVVVKNTLTGERIKFRNPIYEEVKCLKGNQPKLLYQFLVLKQQGKTSEYLKYFPEAFDDFKTYTKLVQNFINYLYSNYISCYIRKEKPLNQYLSIYKTNMYKLHEHYKNELKPNNKCMTKSEVIAYVNALHPTLLMHCLKNN
jgi:hypothetical protein